MIIEEIRQTIRTIPNFPKEGIMFKDITPLLMDANLSSQCADLFYDEYKDQEIDAVAGIESRGFFFGFLLAQKLGVPFIPLRKPNKLPFTTVSIEYDLEYGTSKIEMNSDAVTKGMNVLIHDDLLATGGTAAATAKLIQQQGGNIAGFSFLINLAFLNGAEKLTPFTNNIHALLNYEK